MPTSLSPFPAGGALLLLLGAPIPRTSVMEVFSSKKLLRSATDSAAVARSSPEDTDWLRPRLELVVVVGHPCCCFFAEPALALAFCGREEQELQLNT